MVLQEEELGKEWFRCNDEEHQQRCGVVMYLHKSLHSNDNDFKPKSTRNIKDTLRKKFQACPDIRMPAAFRDTKVQRFRGMPEKYILVIKEEYRKILRMHWEQK